MNSRVVFWSIAYLRPSMIFWRIHRTIKGAGIRVFEKTGLARTVFDHPIGEVQVSSVPRLGSRYHCEAIDLNARSFSFLHDVLILPHERDDLHRAVESMPLLWQFHFGYHDYLLALLDGNADDASERDVVSLEDVLDFMIEWNRIFPLHAAGARSSAWHPYVLSIRIESWVRLYARAHEADIDETDPRLQEVARGVEQMTRVLLRNLEKGTMANHLLRNIKALVLAGLFLDTAIGAQARRIGLKLLERELREQVLEDGCHFERSPMYHVSVMNDVLDMAEAIMLAGSTVPEILADTAGRMTAFLERMRHPDGEIPFFNDSTRSFTLRTEEVLQRGRELCREMEYAAGGDTPDLSGNVRPARISGLLTAVTDRSWIVFDAGNVGPDYQPGHAHCDTLSFEWSLDGRRFVTDTGVFHYRESAERTYARSTAAHNTVEIDGAEQSEVWKSFRVGRRAKIMRLAAERHDGLTVLRGMHNGYRRLKQPVVHERALVVAESGWMAVIDWLHGAGTHAIKSFVHLHPDVALSAPVREDETSMCTAAIDRATMKLHARGFRETVLRETEYYPAFGARESRSSLVFGMETTLPHMTAIVFTPDTMDSPVHLLPERLAVEIRYAENASFLLEPMRGR